MRMVLARVWGSLNSSLAEIVFGVEDGLISIFGLVIGVSTAGQSSFTVLLAGATGAIAAAVSMAAGTYLSVASEHDLARKELAHEEEEIRTRPTEEEREVVDFLCARGFTESEVAAFLRGLRRQPSMMLEFMAAHELRLGRIQQTNAVARAENVYLLDEAVPPAVAALGEPLALGHHLAARACIGPDSLAVVFGPGPIGLVTALGCQEAGARRVVVAGLPEDEARLAIARNWGMETYHATDPAFARAMLAATDGLGPETVFEASGSPAALKQALQLVAKDGTVYAVGIPSREVPLDIAAQVFAEKRLVGSRGYRPRDWDSAAALISRRWADLQPLVSDVLPLGDFEAAFAKAFAREGIRIILDPRR
ncbi:MAG: VIT1/CCC1 transporter family protein [Dehalococcoidales bacterium]|nr:VIT1/CCC1 transporter family protein [Dehalococcoidales bacterium]